MPRGEFVSNLRNLGGSHSDFNKLQTLSVCGEHDLVDDTVLCTSKWCGNIAFGMVFLSLAHLVDIGSDWSCLSDNDVLSGNSHTRSDQSIVVQFVIGAMLQFKRVVPCRLFELLNNLHSDPLLLIHIGSVEQTPEQSTINTALVHDNRILLIVTAIAEDCDDSVLTGRKLSELKKFH